MNNIPETYRVVIAGLVRYLPVVEAVPGVLSIAYMDLSIDADLTEVAGHALAERMPSDVELVVMPGGKALPLLYVVQLATSRHSVVAWKERKLIMREPVLDTRATSITTPTQHAFYLGANDVAKIRGRKVALLDDVVSRGGTRRAMEELLKLAGAASVITMAVCTEDEERPDVISLAHLPVFLH